MKQIITEIEIAASAERVWQILTAFSSFPQWNPFIRSAQGEIRQGAQLQIYIQPPGARAMSFQPVVVSAVPGRELRWLGRFLLPKLMDGEHCFNIAPLTENRVRFTQSEKFTGLLVPLFAGSLNSTRRGFEEMNRALKQLAEQDK